MKRNPLSVHEITTRDWSFAEERERLCRGRNRAGRRLLSEASGPWRQRGRRFAAGPDMRAETMISNSYLTGAGDTRDQSAYDWKLRVLDDCSAIGVSRLVVVRGLLHGRSAARLTGLTIECLGWLSGEVAARGVVLALEPIIFPYFDFLNSLDHATQIVRTVDSPNVELVFDTWYLRNEVDLLDRISDAIDKIVPIYISDHRAGTVIHDDRLLSGESVIPLVEIIRHLDRSGYDGVSDVESFSETLWNSPYPPLLAHSRRWFYANGSRPQGAAPERATKTGAMP